MKITVRASTNRYQNVIPTLQILSEDYPDLVYSDEVDLIAKNWNRLSESDRRSLQRLCNSVSDAEDESDAYNSIGSDPSLEYMVENRVADLGTEVSNIANYL